MYSVKVEASFSSAHNLRGYKGKCEDLHGHNWRVEVVAAKDTLDKIGMVMDFHELKSALQKVIVEMDHKYLNKLRHFKKVNPTSENMARYIYDSLKSQCKELKTVTVWENPTSSATYEE